ncbi:hypothetical protein Ddye_029879 [Dipteronia dyeriana]|uniref:Uncharacterized protein n=1 Tax=Dipteronia dyeriana TaxID=168575 RepID=A0AAD9WLY6_9ROSI|nr:hypothetical protein Ddye_029879 [Dipteronia dyeriana]
MKNRRERKLAFCLVGKVMTLVLVNKEAFIRVFGTIWKVSTSRPPWREKEKRPWISNDGYIGRCEDSSSKAEKNLLREAENGIAMCIDARVIVREDQKLGRSRGKEENNQNGIVKVNEPLGPNVMNVSWASTEELGQLKPNKEKLTSKLDNLEYEEQKSREARIELAKISDIDFAKDLRTSKMKARVRRNQIKGLEKESGDGNGQSSSVLLEGKNLVEGKMIEAEEAGTKCGLSEIVDVLETEVGPPATITYKEVLVAANNFQKSDISADRSQSVHRE